jgi:protein CMS1
MKYSPDALDNVLYEPGEPAVLKNVASKKIKADMSKRPSINALSPFEISDYVVSMAKKSKKNLSYVEVEDFRPPTSSINSFESDDSSELFKCVESNMPDLKKIRRDNTLRVLIISGSAIRATELIRQLGSLRQDLGVGKCFAKHFKIEDQLKFFDSKCPSISVGTPNRLSKLFASGHKYFTMDSVDLCIIDTHRDAKQRNIFEIPETCSDLLDFYYMNILPALKLGNTKLIFF